MTGFDRLRDRLVREYKKKTARSRAVFRRAEKVMIAGGSHTIRLWRPYPFFAAAAEGPAVRDIDGNAYIDYWQGHYANILGHNPRLVRRGIAASLERGALHTGFEARHQIELAEALVDGLGGREAKVRFTTSGTLATMYAVMLAQGLTGRDHVLKIGGGWHGASPYLLKGVKYHAGEGFEGRESAGLLDDIVRRTLVTRFNDWPTSHRVIDGARRPDRLLHRRAIPRRRRLPAGLARVPRAGPAPDRQARHPPHLRRDHLRVPLPRPAGSRRSTASGPT